MKKKQGHIPEKMVSYSPFLPWKKDVLTTLSYPGYDLLDKESEETFTVPLSPRDYLEIGKELIANRFLTKEKLVMQLGTVPIRLLAVLKYLHSCGISDVPEPISNPVFNDLPKINLMNLSGSVQKRGFNAEKPFEFKVSGTHEDYTVAFSKAIGELLERYFLSVDVTDASTRSSLQAMRDRDIHILDPHTYQLYPIQIDASVPINWVTGDDLLNEKKVRLPAQYVFWSHLRNATKEPYYGFHTTNGGAGHFTKAKATICALYEHIQRDGFLLYWLNSISPKRITEALRRSPLVKPTIEYFERYGFTVHLLDTTTDIGVPTITAIIVDTSPDRNTIGIGSATGFSLSSIAISALHEALMIAGYQRRIIQKSGIFKLPESYVPFADKTVGQEQRIALWCGPEMYQKLLFFLTGEEQCDTTYLDDRQFMSSEEELMYLLSLLKRAHCSVYAYEVKHNVLTQIGYHVVKTIVPPLVPMYLREDLATVSASRIKTFAKYMGVAPNDLNPLPHPFP
jgi:thiazole/oxazole-forming peptide maturase SagD family component